MSNTSKISQKVRDVLNELYPANPFKRIYEEHYVNYKGVRLFFDFFIKELSCFVECQGVQHTKFVKHFHGDILNFKAQKFRDNLKIEYVQETDMLLVRIYDGETVDRGLVISKIEKAFDSKFNYSD